MFAMSRGLIFDGIVFVDESGNRVIRRLSISKDYLHGEVTEDEIKDIVIKLFKNDGFAEGQANFKNVGKQNVNIVFREIDDGVVRFFGFSSFISSEINKQLFGVFEDIENICIVLYQDNGRVVFANRAFYEALGYTEEELKKKHICEIVEGSYRNICYENVKKRLKGKKFKSAYYGVKLINGKGESKVFDVYGSTVFYESKPAGIMFGIDITQTDNLKKVYAALKEINRAVIKSVSEDELFAKVCDLVVNIGFLASVVAKVKDDGMIDIIHVSGIGEEFFRRVTVGVDGISEYGRGTAGQAFRKGIIVINPDTENNPDMAYWREDFLNLNFQSSCAIPIKVNGRVKYIVFIFADKKNAFINEYTDLLVGIRESVEFALARMESDRNLLLITKVLDDVKECVVITDKHCRIEYVNNAFLDVFGYSIDDVIGKTPLFFTPNSDEKCEETDIYSRLISEGRVEFEYEMVTIDGKRKIFDVRVVSISSNGEIIKFIGLMRDVSLKKVQDSRIDQLSKFYKTLYHINEVFLHANDEDEILKEISIVVVENLDACASFLVVNTNGRWNLSYAAIRDENAENFVRNLKSGIEKLEGFDFDFPFVKAFVSNRVKVSNKVGSGDKRIGIFSSLTKEYGIKSCFAIPLEVRGKVFGVFVAIFDFYVDFSKEYYRLLVQIKGDINTAIENIRNRRWNRIVSVALNAGFSYVVIMDKFFRIIYMNEAALELHGYKEEEIIGRRHSIFSSGQHDKEFLKRMASTLRRGEVFSDVFVYRTKSGRIVEGYTTVIPYKENNEVKYYIAVGKDITKERELQRKLMFISRHDSLTNLPNKDEFLKKVDLLLKSSKKFLAACAIIDINACSYINQVYGYSIGDEIIKEVAKRLTAECRGNDVVGRLVGDKFSFFMFDIGSEEDAIVRLMFILDKLRKPIQLKSGKEIMVSYHIGVSFYPLDSEKGEDLLSKAELALVSSKSKGENEIGFFKKNTQEMVVKTIQLKDELREAVKKGEFVLYYQPYYDVNSGDIAGAEALIRWIHDGRVISPAEFIDVLENTDLIFDVEECIIREAVKTLCFVTRKVPISVNISPRSFEKGYIVDYIKNILEEYNIDGRYLTVEIVERVFMSDRSYAESILNQIRNIGVKIAVDDFGTGYSSLSYIRDLPIDILKIDISFIRGMLFNEKDKSLVKLIISIAKEFGLKTVAEGVEKREQLELLKSMGCNYVQGYLFSKPLSEPEFSKLLK